MVNFFSDGRSELSGLQGNAGRALLQRIDVRLNTQQLGMDAYAGRPRAQCYSREHPIRANVVPQSCSIWDIEGMIV